MVLYSEASRMAFVHVHKTGGTSLARALRDAVPDMAPLPELPDPHAPLSKLFRVVRDVRGEDPAALNVVTIMCHPLAHAVSMYEYWRSDRIPKAERELPKVVAAREHDFTGFLRQPVLEDPFPPALLVDGELPPNVTMLRRENLAVDANAFLRRVLGREVEVEVMRLNATRHAPYRDYLSPDVVELISGIYAWTFATGMYEPGEVPGEEASTSASSLRARVRQTLDRPQVLRAVAWLRSKAGTARS